MSCSGSQCDQSTKVQDPVLDAPQSPDITSEIFTWWGCQRHHPIEREGSCLELYPLFSCFHLHFPLWWWDPENSNSVKDEHTTTCLADQKTFTYLCKGYSEHWCFVASLLFPATGFQTSFQHLFRINHPELLPPLSFLLLVKVFNSSQSAAKPSFTWPDICPD